MRIQPALTLLACALALAGCRTITLPVPVPAPPAAMATAPANDNLNAVVWMQRTAEYRANCETVYRAATARLDALLKDRTESAIVPGERPVDARRLPPAVVLDIDETVLDNSPFQARLVAANADYSDPSFDAWVREAHARAVPGALAFTQAAAKKGITVFYISNRTVQQRVPTLANLRALGFPVKNEDVVLGLGTVVPGCDGTGSEKLCRRRLVASKYRVLMQFGDQLGDFLRIDTNTPDARQALADTHAGWWGDRWFALPNPSYGSWEPALFNNDWKQPRDARRKLKREALDLRP